MSEQSEPGGGGGPQLSTLESIAAKSAYITAPLMVVVGLHAGYTTDSPVPVVLFGGAGLFAVLLAKGYLEGSINDD